MHAEALPCCADDALASASQTPCYTDKQNSLFCEPALKRALTEMELAITRSAMETELAGYLELGMKAEAEQLASDYLADKIISPIKFSAAIDVILVSNQLSRWRKSVEGAYANLSPQARSTMRFKMLSFYWSLHDLESAAAFLTCESGCDPAELLMAMEIYLHSGRMVDAAAVARRCERLLKKCPPDFVKGMLLTAVANYYSKIRKPLRALDYWTHMPSDSAFLYTALISTVELSLLPAFTALQRALDTIAQKQANPDLSIEVQQPGLEDALTADIKRDLLKLKRKINAIVSPARQRELGLIPSPRAHKASLSALPPKARRNKNFG